MSNLEPTVKTAKKRFKKTPLILTNLMVHKIENFEKLFLFSKNFELLPLIWFTSAVSNTIATSHMWLLVICIVAI